MVALHFELVLEVYNNYSDIVNLKLRHSVIWQCEIHPSPFS